MRYAHAKHTSVNRSILVHAAYLLQIYNIIFVFKTVFIRLSVIHLSRSSLALAILMSKLRGSLEYG